MTDDESKSDTIIISASETLTEEQHEKIRLIGEKLEALPQVQRQKDIWQNSFHEFDVYEHTLEFIKAIKELTTDIDVIAAGWLHDIGKPVVATPKFKNDKLEEREPGKPYHDFTNHEKVGQDMVTTMPPDLFLELGLDQQRVAKLVGAHYLPMLGIKEMRKASSFQEFFQKYCDLKTQLQGSDVSPVEIMTMFLADKIAQGKFCIDKNELMIIRECILNDNEEKLKTVYEIQKIEAEQGNKNYALKENI